MEKFNVVFRGYDRDEVNKTITEIVKNYELLLNKAKITESENQKLRKELEHYKEIETTLNNAIFAAEESSNKLKQLARKEAENIINEAKVNSNRIVNDALTKANQAEEDLITLKRNLKIFKRRIRQIVENQLQVVDELDEIDLSKYD